MVSWIMTLCSLVSFLEEFAAAPAMKAVFSCRKLETTYQTAQCHTPDVCTLIISLRENLACYLISGDVVGAIFPSVSLPGELYAG
jgi:hypothetical protein